MSKFEPMPHTVVHSIVQRSMLKWWQDLRQGRAVPARTKIVPENIARYAQDISIFEVVGSGDSARFRFRFHGSQQIAVHRGNFVGRYLDDALPGPAQASILFAYRTILDLKCPLYTERPASDASGVPIIFERLMLPFSSDGIAIDHVVTHLQLFCPDGSYQRDGVYAADLAYQPHTLQAALVS